MGNKFCGSCGAPLPENAKFCNNCGAPVTLNQAEAPVSPAPAANPVQPQPAVINAQKKKSAVPIIIIIVLLVIVALLIGVLIKTNVISFNLGKKETVPPSEQITETEQESESETATETTTATQLSYEKQTDEDVSQFFYGMSFDDLKQRYKTIDSFGIRGGGIAHQPVYPDGTKAPYCAVFDADPEYSPDARTIGYYIYEKGTPIFYNAKLGDSVEEFKQDANPTTIEIFYDEGDGGYFCVAELIGARAWKIQMAVSDAQGSEILDAFVTRL